MIFTFNVALISQIPPEIEETFYGRFERKCLSTIVPMATNSFALQILPAEANDVKQFNVSGVGAFWNEGVLAGAFWNGTFFTGAF